ncbi:TPA: H-NS histone family protein [Salmonella enterica]|uniref:H-NS histone family protein n=1 Tax=Salmonella enterica TaxID=28901 RepID=A0A744CDT6_SALER|nr:H-NS histone family protein [Salmonella enterica]HAF4921891.1 H-NS histone family protein [Salmonella enterica]
MPTYQELKAQAEAMAAKAEEVRLSELGAIVQEIRAKVAEYGITENDIFGRRRGRTGTQVKSAEIKYRDPKTGATWTGRGRPPAWLKGVRNRDRFLA